MPDHQTIDAIDVILPVLDEAAAIPGVLGAMPVGFRSIVVDNGSSDGSDEIAARLGAEVVTEPRRGFGAACFAGLTASRSDIVCFMDCDGSLDPAELPRVSDPVVAGSADLVLGTRIADAGAWPLHARIANRALALMVRRRAGRLTDIGPMRAARREGLLALGLRDRRFGWPLEMVLRAVDAGWRIEEVPVSYRRREGRSKVTGTVRGTARTVADMTRGDAMTAIDPRSVSVIVIAKAPLPGFAKTRLIPELGADGAALVAAAALEDTLWTVAETPVARRVLALDGELDGAGWLPRVDGRSFEILPQRGGGLDERLAGAFADSAAAPALLIGMDTPQVTASLLEESIALLCEEATDAVLGPAADGGWWAIGLREPHPGVFAGVPMSTAETVEHQRSRLAELGLRVRELEQLRDIDTVDDARAVAAVNPWTRTAAALRGLS